MSLDIGILFHAVPLAKGVLEYMQVIESLSSKIDRLSQSELEAGLRALQHASISGTESASLLREARSRFNKAISLEKEDRLVATYLGLAFCQFPLKELNNARYSLRDLSQVDVGFERRIKKLQKWMLPSDPLVGIIGLTFGLSRPQELITLLNLKEVQEQSLKLSRTL